MHYRSGQEAHVGDVVEFVGYDDLRHIGVIQSISPGSSSCNASVTRLVSGGRTPTGFVIITRPSDNPQTVTLGKCDLVRRLSDPTDLPKQ